MARSFTSVIAYILNRPCDTFIVGCDYDGSYYKPGHQFPCSDQCGSCACRKGHVTCSNPHCSK